MAKLLYITANPKSKETSFGLTVGASFLETYRQKNNADEIIELDLFQTYVPEIDEDVLAAWGALGSGKEWSSLSAEQQKKVSGINHLTDVFLSADKYVVVTPLWNLSVPPRMKAFIDTIVMAGKTFSYTENGPVGLLKDRPLVHIQARGGFYSEGPAVDMEFGDRYLRTVFGFIGIHDFKTIVVEGMARFPENAETYKQNAIDHAKKVAETF
nr:FMN-dependent NADH-azoreductase [Bacilli bacterium]